MQTLNLTEQRLEYRRATPEMSLPDDTESAIFPRKKAPKPKDGYQGDVDYMRALPIADIIIDAGHGGIDGGATIAGVMDKDINLAVAKKLYAILDQYGFTTVLNRNGDYALSEYNRWYDGGNRHRKDLTQRSQITRELKTGIVVSLHVNSAPRNKGQHGPIVLHQDTPHSTLLANCIQDALNQQQGTKKKIFLGKPFYILNSVKKPAVIVEMGFISNPNDRYLLTNPDYQQQTADAIAAGIIQYKLVTQADDKQSE
jgi:N-acetylmuramoyl-L-alanine amidase